MGSLLGDGWVSKSFDEFYIKSFLGIQHSSKQLDYLNWKKKRFEEVGFKVSKIYDVSKKYPSFCFHVFLGDYGKNIRHQLYPNNNKTIKRKYLNLLDEEGLAVWYMDDGGKAIHKKNGAIKGREVHIATHSFTYDEHLVIQKYFKTVWDIDVKIYKDRKYFRLALNATNGNKLIDLIKDCIHPSLKYKIDLEYKSKILK